MLYLFNTTRRPAQVHQFDSFDADIKPFYSATYYVKWITKVHKQQYFTTQSDRQVVAPSSLSDMPLSRDACVR
jgi:hypothetical protein